MTCNDLLAKLVIVDTLLACKNDVSLIFEMLRPWMFFELGLKFGSRLKTLVIPPFVIGRYVNDDWYSARV